MLSEPISHRPHPQLDMMFSEELPSPPPYSTVYASSYSQDSATPRFRQDSHYSQPIRSPSSHGLSLVGDNEKAGNIISNIRFALFGAPRRDSFLDLSPTSDSKPIVNLSQQLPSVSSSISLGNLGFIILCALWYASSAVSNNSSKSILNQFRYPVTLTFIQFGFVSGYSVIFSTLRSRFGDGTVKISQGSFWDFLGVKRPSRVVLEGTIMMSLFQIAGHIFSSMATARVSVSTVHTIKALSPLFTVLSYAILFKVRYSYSTYVSLFPLTIGVMLACSFELSGNMFSMLCALGSTLVFVTQNIYSKKFLPKEDGTSTQTSSSHQSGKVDKLTLLLFSSGMAFIGLIPLWIYSDLSSLINFFFYENNQDFKLSSISFYFFLNGTTHFAQNLLAFTILARTSPVTYSIASLVKRIAVIVIAIVWFGQSVGIIQSVGISLTFFGLWLYNRSKADVDKGERKRGKIERRSELLLPSSRSDAQLLERSPRLGHKVLL